MLTQERLKEVLHYNEGTGLFTWLISNSNRVKIGSKAGSKMANGYMEIQIFSNRFTLHRLAWLYVHGEMPENHIDHINGIRDDNRICNLRAVSRELNMQNMREPTIRNALGLLGVHFDKSRNKFIAQIMYNGKHKHLGRFNTKEEAHQAYLTAKREFHSTCTI